MLDALKELIRKKLNQTAPVEEEISPVKKQKKEKPETKGRKPKTKTKRK